MSYLTEGEEKAVAQYLANVDEEYKFLLDNCYPGLGEFGMQRAAYLQADRWMKKYGFSERAVLGVIGSYSGIFN